MPKQINNLLRRLNAQQKLRAADTDVDYMTRVVNVK